ncbi:large ribosomal subunit protein bL34m [Pundamilia nyererei]|uniref:Large ribosomal subunit protein bL34m n=1 Tax=Pundamilia nyererei TaxID=303518 RepID=A0A3B4F1K8_9CICH|nr:PREDICTED: 39S ribosomal protein L34, mitochondrial [Pundamilia nyererei]
MNIMLSSFSRLRGLTHVRSIPTPDLTGTSYLRSFSSWIGPGAAARTQVFKASDTISSQAEGSGVFQQVPWQYQQVRTRKRGTEYQPKNIKRKRTHGWIKRISSQGGIEVILRRMLKGRKSLTH